MQQDICARSLVFRMVLSFSRFVCFICSRHPFCNSTWWACTDRGMYLDYNTHKNQQGDKNPMGADTASVFHLNLTITILLVKRIDNAVTESMCLFGISKPVMVSTVTDALYKHALFCYPISYGDAGDNQRKNRKHSLCKWVPLALILRASKYFVLLSFGFDITLIPSFLLGLYWVGVFAAELCVSFHIFFCLFFFSAHFDLSYFLFYVASCSVCSQRIMFSISVRLRYRKR